MTWLLIALSIASALAGFIWFLSWQPFGRNRGWNDIEHGVRSLLILMVDGGALHIKQRNSEFAFSMVRTSEADKETQATLLLQIPRKAWANKVLDQLKRDFDSQGFAFVVRDSPAVVAEVPVPVNDIWSSSAGAKGAHVARILLKALSVPPNARFDFELVGRHVLRKAPV